MTEHVDIADPNIHEPKGVAAATANTVYVADGAASGSWAKITSSNIDTTSIFNTNKFHIQLRITDISTASFVLVPLPVACTLTRVTTALEGAIATADATITLTNSTGPATIGTITVANSGSAEGDLDSLTPSSNNTFTASTYLKIATNGASTNTVGLNVFLEFTRTA